MQRTVPSDSTAFSSKSAIYADSGDGEPIRYVRCWLEKKETACGMLEVPGVCCPDHDGLRLVTGASGLLLLAVCLGVDDVDSTERSLCA